MSTGSLSAAAKKRSSGKLPNISRRKIRERLTHLLALKPFKKLELYARLQKEGLSNKDRLQITSILKDIASMSRDNTYNLRHYMWNDVNENWPYFTEMELQQLKHRKPQNLSSPLSSDAGSSTSGQSPTSTHTGSPPPLIKNSSGSLKRTRLDDLEFVSGVKAKKQRISNFKKDSLANNNDGIRGKCCLSYSLYGGEISNDNSLTAHKDHRSNIEMMTKKSASTKATNTLSFSLSSLKPYDGDFVPKSQSNSSVNYQQQPSDQQQQSSPTQEISDAPSAYAIATMSFSEKPRNDFSKYTPIMTIEQRHHYVTEFYSNSKEYSNLLEQIEGIGRLFSVLGERLKSERNGSPEYCNIEQQVRNEYKRVCNDTTLHRDKQRFDYLHEKLVHIKQLVVDFDKLQYIFNHILSRDQFGSSCNSS